MKSCDKRVCSMRGCYLRERHARLVQYLTQCQVFFEKKANGFGSSGISVSVITAAPVAIPTTAAACGSSSSSFTEKVYGEIQTIIAGKRGIANGRGFEENLFGFVADSTCLGTGSVFAHVGQLIKPAHGDC